MCKKVLAAAVAVVIALVVINFTGTGRHIRLWFKQSREYVQSQIPEEQEIASLELELERLAGQDKKHYNQVARQRVEVKEAEERVKQVRTKVSADERRVLALEASLQGEKEFVSYEGKNFSRKVLNDELMVSARGLQTEMKRLKALEEGLDAKKKSLEVNEEKLDELRLMRTEMQTELEQLKTALAIERQAAAQEKNTLNDAGYRKLRELINSARKRRAISEEERNLRGSTSNPVRDHESRKKQEEETREFLKTLKGRASANTDKQ